MAGQGLGRILSFLSFMLIARDLGPSLYGAFTFTLIYGSFLAFIPNIGVDPYYSREISSGREKISDLIGVILILKLGGSIIFFILYTGSIFLTTTNNSVQYASFFTGIAFILLAFNLTGKTILITSSRAGYAGILDIIQSGILILLVLLFVHISPTVSHAAEAFLISQLVVTFLIIASVWYIHGLPNFPSNILIYLKILRRTIPLALLWFISDLYLRADTAMLFYLRGDVETGLYGASYRLVEGVCTATLVVVNIALPRFSKAWTMGIDEWKKELRYGLALVFIIVLLPVIVFSLAPNFIINLLYGLPFAESAKSLRILGIGTFFLCFGQILGIALTSINHEKSQLVITIIALIINVLLNLKLIRLWGGEGAAIATLISAIIYSMLALYKLFNLLNKHAI
jgi:O-antigen/teichoic acid export membrane protein